MDRVFGIDVGGTTIKIGFFENGSLISKWEIPTPKIDTEKFIVNSVSNSLLDYCSEHHVSINSIKGIGIGIPGIVKGDSITLTNLDLKDYNLVQNLKDHLGLPLKIFINNDANLAALGEHMYDSDSPSTSIFFTLGTGVGGGIIINNKLYEGAYGNAAEFGHILVDPTSTTTCGCGLTGCLETISSATGICNTAIELLKNTNTKSELRNYKIDDLNAKVIFDVAKQNDKLALEIVDKVSRSLAIAVATINTVIDPNKVIIGGGVSKAGTFLLDHVTNHYKDFAMHPYKDIKFILAKLGNDAGIYGAYYLVKNNT